VKRREDRREGKAAKNRTSINKVKTLAGRVRVTRLEENVALSFSHFPFPISPLTPRRRAISIALSLKIVSGRKFATRDSPVNLRTAISHCLRHRAPAESGNRAERSERPERDTEHSAMPERATRRRKQEMARAEGAQVAGEWGAAEA
jgi:hypothetical protein